MPPAASFLLHCLRPTSRSVVASANLNKHLLLISASSSPSSPSTFRHGLRFVFFSRLPRFLKAHSADACAPLAVYMLNKYTDDMRARLFHSREERNHICRHSASRARRTKCSCPARGQVKQSLTTKTKYKFISLTKLLCPHNYDLNFAERFKNVIGILRKTDKAMA